MLVTNNRPLPSYVHSLRGANQILKPSSALYSTQVSTEFADVTKRRIQLVLDLQSIYNNNAMAPKKKAQRLKSCLLELIQVLPENEFNNSQLPMANSVINFIDQTPNPIESFSVDEMLILLKSVLSSMTLGDVKYMDFFPRFYNSLRKSDDYNANLDIRLELFEIFINYIMLSDKREAVVKVIDAFINEEVDLHNDNPKDEIVLIMLEAFKTIKPDTATMVHLVQLISKEKINENDGEFLNLILQNFFKASDEEISKSFDDNFVSDRLILLLDELNQKVEEPIKPFIELLYFSTKNNFENVSIGILDNLAKLSDDFKNPKYHDIFVGDILFALVGSALNFGILSHAKTLTELLQSSTQEKDYIEEEWMSILQYNAFTSDESTAAIKVILDLNSRLDNLNKDYSFEDVDSYNQVLESLCWSKKSFRYINQFTQDFESTFGLQPDSKSVATLFNYLISTGDLQNATNVFMQNKDRIDWENDYDGYYILSLFKLVASVWESSQIDWTVKVDVYQNVHRYEYMFDKKSVYRMMKASFDCKQPEDDLPSANFNETLTKFGIIVMLDQLPTIKKGDQKLTFKKYQDIFELIYDFISKSKFNEMNVNIYDYLSTTFEIPYEYYPGFIKMFIDCERPDMAMKVFADMKSLAKEKKLPPPSEELYIYLFKSFGRFRYEDGIFKLHLSMKMDLSINLNCRLLNSLMEGYAALEDPFKTRDVFNIAYSLPKGHGLDNESAYWMLKSLKYAAITHVNQFYTQLSNYDVLVDPYLFSEYLIANCYHEQFRTALDILIDTNENGDPTLINDHVLKTLHNHCLHDGVRKDLDQYASKCFPDTWQTLKDSNQLTDNKEYPDLLANPYDQPAIEVKKIESSK